MKPTSWFAEVNECRQLHFGFWQCPPFLFIVLGCSTIISMVVATILTRRYVGEPEIVIIPLVSFLAVLFLSVGQAVIGGFNKIAEASRMKTQFISIVSHQLRSPLAVFKWTLEAMEDIMKKDGEGKRDGLGTSFLHLSRSTEQMIGLVNTLLELARIESGRLVLVMQPCSLVEVTERVIHNYREYADASQATISFTFDDGLPAISSDPQRARMVIETLLDNAIRYAGKIGSVEIGIKRQGDYLYWTISDTGIGIPFSQQKFIFQKFFRGANGTQFQTEGTGVGLFIAREIIRALGGNIGFTSEEGKGSRFWFTLPVAPRNGSHQ